LRRILVVKHSALGDIVLTLPHLRALREAHAADHLVAATTRPYRALLEASGLFDEVWEDPRAGWLQPLAALGWMRRLRAGRFDRVYDLQGTQRTRNYFRALAGSGVEWVGNARGASHHHPDIHPPVHITLHRRRQLERAGIGDIRAPDLDFLSASLAALELPTRFTLLVPGGAAHRPEKRWPVAGFIAVARALLASGSTPVLVGTAAEAGELASIAETCPGVRNLGGRTSLAELAELGRRAEGAIGNDTGPMHLFAAVGSPVVVLYGPASDPALIRPWGRRVAVLRAPHMQDLTPECVLSALAGLQASDCPDTPRPDEVDPSAHRSQFG
jgi:ADP-heptose:LPS heptosyltransferase